MKIGFTKPAFTGQQLFAAATLIAVIAGITWVLCALICALWLAYQVPLTTADLVHASWLPGYSTATQFSGWTAGVFGGILVIMGLALAVVKSTPMPLLIAIVMTLGLVCNSEDLMVRIGIATDTIKIGCFVYTAKECREMQGLPVHNARSRYDTNGGHADWYDKALNSVVHAQPRDVALQSVPGWALLQAPLYVFETKSIRQKLAAQRQELSAQLVKP